MAIAFLGLCLGLSLMINAGLIIAFFVGQSASITADQAEDEFPQFEEVVSYGAGEVKAVRIDLSGIITREMDGGLFGSSISMCENILRQVRAARQDEAVRAILLEVDSPGGGVTPSDEIYAALKAFRESREDRRVLVFVRDMAASGGYYAAMAADWIVAEPTSLVGSIGVIVQALNWSVLSEKLGVVDTTIKAGANKDMLNPFRETKPEHVELLQTVVDDMHRQFKAIVSEGRGLDEAALAPLADGRIFTATQAKNLGLIDEIGYWDDALAALAKHCEAEQVCLVRYKAPESFFDLLFSARNPFDLNLLRRSAEPRILYKWNP